MRRPNGAGVSKWTAATSTFDLEKVACMRGIVQCVAKFTSRLGVNVQKRLAAGDLVAEAAAFSGTLGNHRAIDAMAAFMANGGQTVEGESRLGELAGEL